MLKRQGHRHSCPPRPRQPLRVEHEYERGGAWADDFARPRVTYQIGVPPGRIDILTELTGLTFDEAWSDRMRRPVGEIEVDFIGRASFIRNKCATGRAKDLGDIKLME